MPVDVSHVKLDRSNPFNKLLLECENDANLITQAYAAARTSSLATSVATFQSPSFTGPTPDPILSHLLASPPPISPPDYHPPTTPAPPESQAVHTQEPPKQDPRHNIALLALPPPHITALIARIQARLRRAAPRLWLVPPANLHMTTLEIANSLPDVAECARRTRELCAAVDVTALCDAVPGGAPAGLCMPLLTFDARAVALTFLPYVRGSHDNSDQGSADTSTSTYHALRAAVYTAVVGPPARRTGVVVNSRYVAASAHVTVARFATSLKDGGVDFVMRERSQGCEDEVLDLETVDRAGVDGFVAAVQEVNAWLESEYWPRDTGGQGVGGEIRRGDGEVLKVRSEADGEGNPKKRMFEADTHGVHEQRTEQGRGTWYVGREAGLQLRNGRSWYGGGDVVVSGRGNPQV